MIDTERLYDKDVYLRKFTAVVQECRKTEKGFAVLLDRSAFYPEGGGQPCDQGIIDGIAVLDVQEEKGELIHYIENPVTPGQEITGEIRWEHRFDLMQQHSGEHMVSGLVHEAYGYDNVGFHMGSEVITIDFNGMLTREQLAEIEDRTNEKIWENQPVEIFYPSEEERKTLPYRSKKELTGKVRLVRFPGTDLCACCGTHVTHTGEIGMVKILSVEKFREGVRVEMICGKRVFNYLKMVDEQNHKISTALSARPDQTADAVRRLQEENFQVKGRVYHLEEELVSMEAEKWTGCGNVLLFKDTMESDQVRKLADGVMQTCQGRAAVFSRNPDGSYKYAIGEKDGNLSQFVKAMNQKLNGRGGGRPFFVQGSVQAEEQEIRSFWQEEQ